MQKPRPPSVTGFGNRSFKKVSTVNEVTRVSPNLMGLSLSKKRKRHQRSFLQRKDHKRTRREGGPWQGWERDLTRTQPCWHFDPELLASRTVRKDAFVVWDAWPMVFCYGGLSRMNFGDSWPIPATPVCLKIAAIKFSYMEMLPRNTCIRRKGKKRQKYWSDKNLIQYRGYVWAITSDDGRGG